MKILTLSVLALLSTTVAQAQTFSSSQGRFPGRSVAITSGTGGQTWSTSQYANGVCIYSYSINGLVTGPIALKASTCNVSITSNTINSVSHYVVKVNGKVVVNQ
jgi:hypothetical protein